jgi:transcriptional regulator with XRE-family HTH domain
MYAFGKVIRRLITEYDTSQADICRVTGIKKQNLSVICKGETRYPSIHVCKRLADYFGMTLDELWALVEEEEGE